MLKICLPYDGGQVDRLEAREIRTDDRIDQTFTGEVHHDDAPAFGQPLLGWVRIQVSERKLIGSLV